MKKMNVIQCVNGHFYDGQKYEFCPHCGAIERKGRNEVKIEFPKKDTKGKNGFLGRLKKNVDKTKGVFDGIEEDTDYRINDKEKESIIEQETEQDMSTPETVESMESSVLNEPSRIIHFETKKNMNDIPFGDSSADDVQTSNNRELNITGVDEEKTFGFFHINSEDTNTSTTHSEPVVGWIVCVRGKHLGESFNVFAGRNSIGRGNNNVIVIPKDPQISREKHAFITYEPKKRVFYITSGDSSGLTYLNEEMVDSSILRRGLQGCYGQ